MARAVARAFNDDVFINCPYDPEYARIFEALIFAVHALGFRARAAREIDDGADVRINKIIRIIGECRYGIHDLSRTEIDPKTELPRFNMPLELGLFIGARRFGNPDQKKKHTMILDVEKFRYRDFISDLAGIDIHDHGGDAVRAVREVRNWLATASQRQLQSANVVAHQYVKFRGELPIIAADRDFELEAIPYVDFLWIVVDWLAP